jgi:3-dehydroquinate synthetase
LKLCAGGLADRVAAHLAAVGLPTKLADVPGGLPDADGLMALMAQDKKVRRGALVFVLARGIGDVIVAKDISAAEVAAFLAAELAR